MPKFDVGLAQSWYGLLHLGHIHPDAAMDMRSSALLELDSVAVHLDMHGIVLAHHDVLDEGLEPVVEYSCCCKNIVSDQSGL